MFILLWIFLFFQSKAGPVSDYIRGEDVLDIWFDSGASWAAVLEGTTETSFTWPNMNGFIFQVNKCKLTFYLNRRTTLQFSVKTHRGIWICCNFQRRVRKKPRSLSHVSPGSPRCYENLGSQVAQTFTCSRRHNSSLLFGLLNFNHSWFGSCFFLLHWNVFYRALMSISKTIHVGSKVGWLDNL